MGNQLPKPMLADPHDDTAFIRSFNDKLVRTFLELTKGHSRIIVVADNQQLSKATGLPLLGRQVTRLLTRVFTAAPTPKERPALLKTLQRFVDSAPEELLKGLLEQTVGTTCTTSPQFYLERDGRDLKWYAWLEAVYWPSLTAVRDV